MNLENKSLQLSEDVREKLREANLFAREQDKRIKELEPVCPDDSGEIGKFDQEASDLLGGMAIYKTESGKYFHWVDTVKKGKIFDSKRFGKK
ncbi:MAG TPA: hypothetical protein VKC53_03805 [Patescibacteria group bacterium]|nr:hypothetical protein [Patescibacteria group bacterium]